MKLRMMVLFGLFVSLIGCATVDRAQLADGATTWIGLSHGFSEGNPVLNGLSGPGILAAKLAVTQAVKLTPEEFCTPATMGLTVTGYAAALYNIGMICGSGIAALPVALLLAWWSWDTWYQDSWYTCQDPWGEMIPSATQESFHSIINHSFWDMQ